MKTLCLMHVCAKFIFKILDEKKATSKRSAERFNLHVRNCKGGEGGGFVDDANGALSCKVL